MRRASPNKDAQTAGPSIDVNNYLDFGSGHLANFTVFPKDNNALDSLDAILIKLHA